MSDWMPIESAPKDGNAFLACDARVIGFQQVVFYDPAEPDGSGVWTAGRKEFLGREQWCWAVADGNTYHADAFTHWMPLPEPPKV